jgi:hypothetical protein
MEPPEGSAASTAMEAAGEVAASLSLTPYRGGRETVTYASSKVSALGSPTQRRGRPASFFSPASLLPCCFLPGSPLIWLREM